jgi:hypothetical protein
MQVLEMILSYINEVELNPKAQRHQRELRKLRVFVAWCLCVRITNGVTVTVLEVQERY